MRLSVRIIDVPSDFILLDANDAASATIKWHDITELTGNFSGTGYAPAYISPSIPSGTVGVSKPIASRLQIHEETEISVLPRTHPSSIEYILKKMNGEILTSDEINNIISDIHAGKLSDKEISPFVVATHIHNLNLDEIEALTRSFVGSGETLTFKKSPIIDKHSIGGVPGNKISLLVVPIIGAANLVIPKTSSRAITGAGGTADLMEALAPVSFTSREIENMTNKVGAVIVWGGTANIAPVDNTIIQYENPFKIDPRGIMLASVLAKKKAVGADICVIDIPTGNETKIPTEEEGNKLAHQLIDLGKRLGIKISCAVTNGNSPVGHNIGVNLEVAEALRILEQKTGSGSLMEKSCAIAGIALEMSGVATRNEGYSTAMNLIQNGKALKKMKEIIEIQGGDPTIKSDDLSVGDFSYDFCAPFDGYVVRISNRSIVDIARTAGSPSDHGAGIHISKLLGEHVKTGEIVFTIYAETEWKLSQALKIARESKPFTFGGMLIQRIE